MKRLLTVLFLAGVLLQAVLLLRAWRAWDGLPLLSGNVIAKDIRQFDDLVREFVKDPSCLPTWKTMSGGTDLPGCFLPGLLGLPVVATGDPRVPAAVVSFTHLLAGLLLVVVLRREAGDRFTAFYLAVFWLSPWRLFHSAFTWDPNLVILPAAVHLWCSAAGRREARPVPSLVLGATLALAAQVHGSALFLFVLTALLLARKELRVSWPLFAAGAAAGSLTLIPAALQFLRGGTLAFAPSHGFLGRGFVYVFPLFRTYLFWFRLGSLDFGRLHDTDSVSCASAGLHGGIGDVLRCALYRGAGFLAIASILLPVVAAWQWMRRRPATTPEGNPWVRTYAVNAFLALLVAGGLSPVTIQAWHVLIALPAACLPVAGWLEERWPFRRRSTAWLVALFLIARLPIAALLASDYPVFCRVAPDVARAIQD